MATLTQIETAAGDQNLRARLETAAASTPGIAGSDSASRQAAWDRIIALVSEPLPSSGSGQTLADVLADARAVFDAAVTDAMIREAVVTVLKPVL